MEYRSGELCWWQIQVEDVDNLDDFTHIYIEVTELYDSSLQLFYSSNTNTREAILVENDPTLNKIYKFHKDYTVFLVYIPNEDSDDSN